MRYSLERTLPLTAVTSSLAFSSDGALLAAATEDKQASTVLLRLADGALLPAPRFARRDLAFAPDGSLFVAGVSVERFVVGGAKVSKALLRVPGHPRGLTKIKLSPNGLWLAVVGYMEDLSLWYLGGPSPALRWTTRATGLHHRAFTPDSAALLAAFVDYSGRGRVELLRRVALSDDGALALPEDALMPEGVSVFHPLLTSRLGVIAVAWSTPALWRLDGVTLAAELLPSEIGTLNLRGDHFVLAAEASLLVSQTYEDPPAGPRQWRLVHATLPSGASGVCFDLGVVSAGRIAISPTGDRVAYTRSDTDRTLHVLRREA